MIAMLRDTWWWPWWVSSLIDLAVVIASLFVLHLTASRTLKAIAAAFIVAGLAAAVLAPIVMTEHSEGRMPDEPTMQGRTR